MANFAFFNHCNFVIRYVEKKYVSNSYINFCLSICVAGCEFVKLRSCRSNKNGKITGRNVRIKYISYATLIFFLFGLYHYSLVVVCVGDCNKSNQIFFFVVNHLIAIIQAQS